MSLEWQTENEEGWDAPAPSPSSPRRPRLLFLLVVSLALLFALLLWRQAGERLIQAEERAQAGIEASDRIARTAAATADQDLLKTVLSGRDQHWVETQYELLQKNLLLYQAPRPFHLRPLTATKVVSVSLSPDLRSALLVVDRAYATGDGEQLTLRQSRVYRHGSDRWLLSPPLPGYWGEWRFARERFLTVAYPARDEAIARRLALDLDAQLRNLCVTLPDLDCPADLHLRLRFTKDAGDLLDLPQRRQALNGSPSVDLPAPSLIGLPAGQGSAAERAYRALLRGYGEQVAAAAIAQATGYECCQHILFFEATLDWQLDLLDFHRWSLSKENYLAAADLVERLPHSEAHWYWPVLVEGAYAERWQAYSIVEMLLSGPDRSPLSVSAIQRALLEHDDFYLWLAAVSSLTPESFGERWRRFLHNRVEASQIASDPVPDPPAQDLLVACRDDEGGRVYRYDPRADRWLGGLADEVDFDLVFPLPGDDGVLLTGRRWGNRWGQTLLWRPGSETILSEAEVGYWFYTAEGNGGRTLTPGALPSDQSLLVPAGPVTDPQGQYVTVWVYDGDGQARHPALLDLESCDGAGGCRWQFVSGPPVWSPDGEQIIVVNGRALLLRGGRDGDDWQQFSTGRSPFWLEDDLYGYVSREHPILLRWVGDSESRPLLRDEAVQALSPAGSRQTLLPVRVAAGPPGSGALALLFRGSADSAHYLYLVQRSPATWQEPLRAEELHLLVEPPFIVVEDAGLSFSPDGRWLTVQTVGGGEQGRQLWLFDVARREAVLTSPAMVNPPGDDWTADGLWLARPRTEGVIELVAPSGRPFHRFLYAPSPSLECTSLAWIEPSG